MPLVIKELHIKASVSGEDTTSETGTDTSSEENETGQEIISACVEKILDILKDKMER